MLLVTAALERAGLAASIPSGVPNPELQVASKAWFILSSGFVSAWFQHIL